MTLTDARLASLVQELQRLRGEIGQFRAEIRTVDIAVSQPAFDDRNLLMRTSTLHGRLQNLKPRLEGIAAQLPELSRRAHGGGSPSAFGHLGNVRGTLPLVEQDLMTLEKELRSVHGKVTNRMNDPLRTPAPPSGGVTELLEMAIDITTKVVQKFKAARKQGGG